MFESYLAPILFQYVTKYIKNLQPEDLKVTLWGGEVVLRNLEIRADEALREAFNELKLPGFSVLSGRIKELRLNVPWHSIQSDHILITVNNVEILLGPVSSNDSSLDDNTESPADQGTPQQSSTSSGASSVIPTWVQGWIDTIRANITFHLNALTIKYILPEGDDGQVSIVDISCRSVSFTPADENWVASFIDPGLCNFVRNEVKIRGVGMRIYRRPVGHENSPLSLDEIQAHSVMEEVKANLRLSIPLRPDLNAEEGDIRRRKQIDVFFDSSVAITLSDFQYEAIMSLSSPQRASTTPTTPEKSKFRSSAAQSPPATPTTPQKKGWGSWISWGWGSKSQDSTEAQKTIQDDSEASNTTVQIPPESPQKSLSSSSKPSVPFLMNIIVKSGSLFIQNRKQILAAPAAAHLENVAFLKFDWLGIRISAGGSAETSIGARQLSMSSSPTAVPCVSYTQGNSVSSSSVDPSIVCAPDSFFSTASNENGRPLHTLDGWKELYRQFSLLIHSTDYSSNFSSQHDSGAVPATFKRPKMSLFVNDTFVHDAQDTCGALMRFVSSKKTNGSSTQEKLGRDASAGVETLILNFWKRPSMEMDLNLRSLAVKINRINLSVDSLRYYDRVIASDSSEAPWWSNLSLIQSGVLATNVCVSEDAEQNQSMLIRGINIFQANWTKNLATEHAAARNLLSPSFPASSVDATVTTNSKICIAVNQKSMSSLADASAKVLSIFGATPLNQGANLAVDALPGQLDLEMGNSSFSQSLSSMSILKLETVHLGASFTDSSKVVHRIVNFSNPHNSNRSAVALSMRIPWLTSLDVTSTPLVHISTLPALIFLPAPFLRWIIDSQTIFNRESGLFKSKNNYWELITDSRTPCIEDSLPSDFASKLISHFSDYLSFQWALWSRSSLNVDIQPLQIVLAPGYSDCDAIIIGMESIRANLSLREDFAASLIQVSGISARLMRLDGSNSFRGDVIGSFSIKSSIIESRTPSASPTLSKKAESTIAVDPIRVSLGPQVLEIISSIRESLKRHQVIPMGAPVIKETLPGSIFRRTTSKDHLGLVALAALRVSLNIPSIQLNLATKDATELAIRIDSISSILNLSWRANMILEKSIGSINMQIKSQDHVAVPVVSCGGLAAMFSSLYSSGDPLQKSVSQACSEVSVLPINIQSNIISLHGIATCLAEFLPSKSSSERPTSMTPHRSLWRFTPPIIFRAGRISFAHGNLLRAAVGSIQLSAGMLQHQHPGAESPVLGQLVSLQVFQIVVDDILDGFSFKMDRISQAKVQNLDFIVEEALSVSVADASHGLLFRIIPSTLKKIYQLRDELQSALEPLQTGNSSSARSVDPQVADMSENGLKHHLSINFELPFVEIRLGEPEMSLQIKRPQILTSLRGASRWQATLTIDGIESRSDNWLFWSGPRPPRVILVRSEPPSGMSRSVFIDVHPGLCLVLNQKFFQCLASLSSVGSSQSKISTAPRHDSIRRVYDFISSLDLKINLGSVSLAIETICAHFDQLFLACSTINSGERTSVLSIIGLCIQSSVPAAPNGFVAEPDRYLVEPFDVSTQLRLSIRDNIHSKSMLHLKKLCYAQGQIELIGALRVRIFGEDLKTVREISELLGSKSPQKPYVQDVVESDHRLSHKVTLTSLALHVVAGAPTDSIELGFPASGTLTISPWGSDNVIEGILIRWRLPQLVEVDSVDFLLTPVLQDVSWNKKVTASIMVCSFDVDSQESHVVAEQHGQKFDQYNPARDAGTVPMLSVASKAHSDNSLSAISDAWAVRIKFSEPISPKLLIPESLLSLLACLDVQLRVAPPEASESSLLVDFSVDQSLEIEINLTGDRQNPLQSGTILNLSAQDLRARGRIGPGLDGCQMTSSILQGTLELSQCDSSDLGLRRLLHPMPFDLSLKQYAARQELTFNTPYGIDIEASPSSIIEIGQSIDHFLWNSNSDLFTQIVIRNDTASSLYYGQVGVKEILHIGPLQTAAYSWRKLMSPSQRVLRFQIDPQSDQSSPLNAQVDLNKLIERFWMEKQQKMNWHSNYLLRVDDAKSVLLHISVKIDEFRIVLKLEGSHKIKNESYLASLVLQVPEESSSLCADEPIIMVKKQVSLLRTIAASASSSTSQLGPQTVSVSCHPFQNSPSVVDRISLSPHAPRRCFGALLTVSTVSATSSDARATTSSVTVLRTRTIFRNMLSLRNMTPLALETKFENPLQEQISSPVVSCAPGVTVPYSFDPNLIIEGTSAPIRFKFGSTTSWSYPQILFSLTRSNAPSSHNLYVKLHAGVEQRQVPIVAEIIEEDGVQILLVSFSYLLINHTNYGFVFYRGQAQVASSKLRLDAAGALSADSVLLKAGDVIPYYWKMEKRSQDSPVSPFTLGFVVQDSSDSATVLWSNSIEPRLGADQMFVFRQTSNRDKPLYDIFVFSCTRGLEPSAPIQLVIKPRFVVSNKTTLKIIVSNVGTKRSHSLDPYQEGCQLIEWTRSDSSDGIDTRVQIGLENLPLSKSLDIASLRQRAHVYVPADTNIRRYIALVISSADVDGTTHVAITEESSPSYLIKNGCMEELEIKYIRGCAPELSGRIFALAPDESLDVLIYSAPSETSDSSMLFAETDQRKSDVAICIKLSTSSGWSDAINLTAITDSNVHISCSNGREKAPVMIRTSSAGPTTEFLLIPNQEPSPAHRHDGPASSPLKSLRFIFRSPKISVSLRDKLSAVPSSLSAAPVAPPARPAAPTLLASPQIIWSRAEQEDEVLLLTITEFAAQFGSVGEKKSILLHLSGIQLDSFLPESQFVVPLSLRPKDGDDGQTQGALFVSASYSSRTVHSLLVSFSSELIASVDERLIQYATSVTRRLSTARTRRNPAHRVTAAYSLQVGFVAQVLAARPLHINALSIIMPSKVRLSAQIRPGGKGRVFVSFSDAVFSFRPLRSGRISCFPDRLLQALMSHYISEALPQAPAALASLDVLGNPLKLARHFGAGVRDFLILPIQLTAEKGAFGLAEGLLRGSGSLFGHITGGVLQSFSGLSQSLARVLDPEHQGLFGVTSIVTQPIEAVKSSGISGLARGITSGIFRAITAPIGGALDFVSATTSDLSDSVLAVPLSWSRQPRSPIPVPQVITVSAYSASKYRSKIIPFEFPGEKIQLQQVILADLIGASSEAPCVIILCSHRTMLIIMNDEVLSVVKAAQIKKSTSQENTISIDSSTQVRLLSANHLSCVMRWFSSK